MSAQAETKHRSIREQVKGEWFKRGIADFLQSQPMAEAPKWERFDYERGRLFAAWCAGRGIEMPRHFGRRLQLVREAFRERALI